MRVVLHAGMLRGMGSRGVGCVAVSAGAGGAEVEVVDLCGVENEAVDAEVAVPSVARVKVEGGGQSAEGDDEMVMDL